MINKRRSLKDILNSNQSCISKVEDVISTIVNEEAHKEPYKRDSNKQYISDEDSEFIEDSDCVIFEFAYGKVYLAELFEDEDGWFYYNDINELEDTEYSDLYYSGGIFGWRTLADLT